MKVILAILLSAGTAWAQTTFRLDNDTDIEDTYIAANAPNINYGTSAPIFVSAVGGTQKKMLFKFSNVHDSIGAGATITFAACSLRCVASNGDTGDVYIYPMWKTGWPEVDTGSGEGGATWDDWGSPDNEWGTEGVECAKDAGSFNNEDDGACTNARADKKETAIDSVINMTVGWHGWEVTAFGQTAYDASEPWCFVFEEGATSGESSISPGEGAYQPILVIIYTTDGVPAASPRRRKLLTEGSK